MKKNGLILPLTLLLIFIFTSTAFANSDEELIYTTQVLETITDDNIIEKQNEINKYLFEDHVDEIAEMGFEVTYTAPVDHYIEVGIIPFNQKNADYLKNIFGDEVTIVEGSKVAIISQVATDTPVTVEEQKSQSGLYLLFGAFILGIIGLLFLKKKRAR